MIAHQYFTLRQAVSYRPAKKNPRVLQNLDAVMSRRHEGKVPKRLIMAGAADMPVPQHIWLTVAAAPLGRRSSWAEKENQPIEGAVSGSKRVEPVAGLRYHRVGTWRSLRFLTSIETTGCGARSGRVKARSQLAPGAPPAGRHGVTRATARTWEART